MIIDNLLIRIQKYGKKVNHKVLLWRKNSECTFLRELRDTLKGKWSTELVSVQTKEIWGRP